MAWLKNKYGGWFEKPDDELDPDRIMNKKIRNAILDKKDNIRTINLMNNGRDGAFEKVIEYNNMPVGNVSYLVEKGQFSIYNIEVNELYRRKGFATKLMKSVQREAGDKDINFGTLKPDGEKLLNNIAEITEVKEGLLGAKTYKGRIKLN